MLQVDDVIGCVTAYVFHLDVSESIDTRNLSL